MDIRSRISSNIEKKEKEIVGFLQKLISIPSVTGKEKDIQNFIAEKLDSLGLFIDTWEPNKNELEKHPGFVSVEGDYRNRPNVVGVCKSSGGKRSLLFNGHVDVIPPGSSNLWRHDPWSGKIESGRIYGRGASDMKSGLAAMTMALSSVMESEVRLKGDVILEYVVDEELSGNGTLACILRGYKADAGVCCESSSMKVQPASIGRIWFEIDVPGKAAGIQRRWEGVNAITKGYKIVKAVSSLERKRIAGLSHHLYPDIREALPCMVCTFEAGSYPSAFPDNCVLKGSLATVPGEDSEEVKRTLVKHVHEAARKDAWLGKHLPQITFTGYFAEPSEIPVSSPIVKNVALNFERIMGRPPVISGRIGAADTRFLNKYGHTPTVIFGPGLTEQMHATNEWVNVKDLISATKILALTIYDWCS